MKTEEDNAERSLIGSILVGDAARVMTVCVNRKVREAWFDDAFSRAVWEACVSLWEQKKYDGIDPVTVLAECARLWRCGDGKRREQVDAGTLSKIIDGTPTSAHAEYYIELVQRQWQCRFGKRAAVEFVDRLPQGPSIAVQELNKTLVDMLDTGDASETVGAVVEKNMAEYTEANRIRMVEKNMDYVPGIPLPWKRWTFAYNGLQTGLHVVGARPSVGKTAVILECVRFWCERGFPVAFNSLDMEPKNLVKRPEAEISGVSVNKASFGTTSQRDMESLREAGKKIAAWPLHLCSKRDLDDFRAWCTLQKLKHGVRVIVVDFLQLMTFEGATKMSVDDRTATISAALKGIALDLDVPVVALSQLNRQCEMDGGREPSLSDLRGSGSLEQDAFTVMLLHKDPVVSKNWDAFPPVSLAPFGESAPAKEYTAKKIRPVWAILAKNQNGRTARFPMVFYPNYFFFMLGNPDGHAEECQDPATKRKVMDNTELFSKVHGDWRGSEMEKALRLNGMVVEDKEENE